ncbi:hypothetical protein N44_01649 [Microcystis aeruginosa NIES-44]|uniref:Uncharacterized protein n=1 Tax=Microcystis aeruginosa NIES-44 TaxID=449439 RepID=A0A0A1VT37_MICAE|nr:hypothetical protein N44_01649 [Microcystis aeruginosa NIES-44]
MRGGKTDTASLNLDSVGSGFSDNFNNRPLGNYLYLGSAEKVVQRIMLLSANNLSPKG